MAWTRARSKNKPPTHACRVLMLASCHAHPVKARKASSSTAPRSLHPAIQAWILKGGPKWGLVTQVIPLRIVKWSKLKSLESGDDFPLPLLFSAAHNMQDPMLGPLGACREGKRPPPSRCQFATPNVLSAHSSKPITAVSSHAPPCRAKRESKAHVLHAGIPVC